MWLTLTHMFSNQKIGSNQELYDMVSSCKSHVLAFQASSYLQLRCKSYKKTKVEILVLNK